MIDYHAMFSLIMTSNIRQMFLTLAEGLIAEGKNDTAEEVLDRALELTPRNPFFLNMGYPPHEIVIVKMIDAYLAVNADEKAESLYRNFIDETQKCLAFIAPAVKRSSPDYRTMRLNLEANLYYLQLLAQITDDREKTEMYDEVEKLFSSYIRYLPQN